MNHSFVFLLTWIVVSASVMAQSKTKYEYPAAPQSEAQDEYHGRRIADPFRQLEDSDNPATRQWIDAENELTQKFLASVPHREAIAKRLSELWNYERFGLPVERDGKLFFTRNDGLQNQDVLFVQPSDTSKPTVLLDPNKLREDGTVALAQWTPSDDGRFVGYALAEAGSDWRTWYVRDVVGGNDLADKLQWIKFSEIAWLPDGSGFFYSRYDAPAEGAELTGSLENQQLYLHRIGDEQAKDRLIYRSEDQPKWGFVPQITDDGRFAVISNWKGSEPEVQILIVDLREAGYNVRELIMGFDAEYALVGNDDDTLYFVTDNNAPRKRVIAVDAKSPLRDHWREIIPETESVLEQASLLGDRFFASYMKDARSIVKVFDITGELMSTPELPGLGNVSGFGGRRNSKRTFYSFTNYVTPPTIYELNLASNKTQDWKKPKYPLSPERFVTKQVFYESKDGTRIPMMISHRADIKPNGEMPTLLYAYGGFNISLLPQFSSVVATWIDMGGTYAVPNLRGGGEYGREWHEAGMLDRKQNVFDDFICAAEYLIKSGYTNSDRLAIRGGSNGGLLVGASLTQRPELFGACIPAVGVMDMLRFHKFTIGWAWVGEFGSSDDAAQFETLLKYSPLHSIHPNTCYPPTLITTADHDDRVVPGHSFKFAAALQTAQSCDQPILIRIETRAGHGAGTPTSKRIEEYADIYAFLSKTLAFKPKLP